MQAWPLTIHLYSTYYTSSLMNIHEAPKAEGHGAEWVLSLSGWFFFFFFYRCHKFKLFIRKLSGSAGSTWRTRPWLCELAVSLESRRSYWLILSPVWLSSEVTHLTRRVCFESSSSVFTAALSECPWRKNMILMWPVFLGGFFWLWKRIIILLSSVTQKRWWCLSSSCHHKKFFIATKSISKCP